MITPITNTQSLQHFNPDLFSTIRRNINLLKQVQVQKRKLSLKELLQIITTQQLPGNLFEQLGQLILKDILKCFNDHSEFCRQLATNIVIELMPRSQKISSYLPYIFSILIDRTNCHDLQGITNVPQKMRPPPGQKPKILIKIIQSCQQIRLLYCKIIKTIVTLLHHQGDQIRKHLDDIINILRALIMDPAPEVQKTACETLQITCKLYKDLLLHYTEIMGRAVLLPLISKKSKIRIAGLRALTAIFWCGLYKYNAFVFQNLIGFRDPNSVPIKDFYEPSHNINYLATFITDPNNKVRLQFMKNIKIWVCDLDDKYDHHGKLVAYLLSGLFDKDQQIKKTSLEAIQQIGRQIQTERQKDFRQNKQFAIDAKWTWEGKMVGLSVDEPLTKRPSLGSRFFIRGHVRKFWNALYRQVRDINIQNRKRACNLAVYGAIYTQNYLTQYLDDMIPNFLTAIIPQQNQKQSIQCSKKIERIFYYIGRYCEQSSYLHIMKSALQGKLVQSEQFLKATFIALKNLTRGSLQAIPLQTGLCHKQKQISLLLEMIQQSNSIQQIYQYNCKQAQQFVLELLKGLKEKSSKQERKQILVEYGILLVKLWCVGYYEETYSNCFKLDNYVKEENAKILHVQVQQKLKNPQVSNSKLQQKSSPNSDKLISTLAQFFSLYSQFPSEQSQRIQQQQNLISQLFQQYLSQIYQNPPSLMDSDFKFIIVLNNYFLKNTLFVGKNNQKQENSSNKDRETVLLSLTEEIIGESLSYNRSVEILNFTFKYLCWVFDEKEDVEKQMMQKNTLSEQDLNRAKKSYKSLSQILERSLSNLNKFKPLKKIPIYDQHLLQQMKKPTTTSPQTTNNEQAPKQQQMKINQQTFIILYKNACQSFRKFYINKILLTNATLGQMLNVYIDLGNKLRRSNQCVLETLKSIWIVFEVQQVNEEFPSKILFKNQKKENVRALQSVVNYIITTLQTLGEPEHKKVQMLFSILQSWVKCFPVFKNAATPLNDIYPDYNSLFERLIRYAMDEKDIELKQKYVAFFKKANKKMKVWFELEYKMAYQGQKFIKAAFIKESLNL